MPKIDNLPDYNAYEYKSNKLPICPHCDAKIDISGAEMFDLYEEGEHDEVECPSCDNKFKVVTEVQILFTTDFIDEF